VQDYYFAQVPSGALADRFGAKWLLAGSVAVESVLAMLTPAAAHLHVGAVIALRSVAGVFDGIQCPAAISLVAGIAPPSERSRAVGFILSGTSLGAIVGMLVAGFLCDHAGWPSVFYTFGLTGCVWAIAWMVVGYGHVSATGRQSAAGLVAAGRRTPWREIITSRPVWACAGAYTANLWGFVTLLTCLPMYFSDVFGYGMTENGLLSMLPYMADGIMLTSSGLVADRLLRSRYRPSRAIVRKTFCAFGMLASGAFIVLTGALGCHRAPIVACLVASVGMLGVSMPTIAANTMDLSPSDAGTLMGLANAVGNAVSVMSPHVVGALTADGRSTRSQWTKIFGLVAAVDVAGAALFVVFGSGRRQNWAATSDDESSDDS